MKIDIEKPYRRLYLIIVLLVAIFCTGCTLPNPKQKDELAYREAGINKLNEGKYAEAATLLQKALDNSNGRVSEIEIDICFYKAKALINMGKNEEALEVYNAIIEYDKTISDAFLLRGNLYAALNDSGAATKDYDVVIKLEPDKLSNYLVIYKNLVFMGYTNQGESYLRKGTSVNAVTKDDYCLKGQMYKYIQEYDLAKEMYSKAENLGSEEAKLYMAEVLNLNGEKEAAYAIYEAYANDHENDKEALVEMVKILLENESYEQVEQYIDDALSVCDDASRQELLIGKIKMYESMRKYKKALKTAEEYIKLFPDDFDIQREIEFLKTRGE